MLRCVLNKVLDNPIMVSYMGDVVWASLTFREFAPGMTVKELLFVWVWPNCQAKEKELFACHLGHGPKTSKELLACHMGCGPII